MVEGKEITMVASRVKDLGEGEERGRGIIDGFTWKSEMKGRNKLR